MDSATLLTILTLLFVVILFTVAAVNSRRVPNKKKERILEKLDELSEQSAEENPFARRDAVIKLDNLLSKTLQLRFRNDKSCGDNLKVAKSLFGKQQYQDLWDVHKFRNDIVHKDKEVSQEDAQYVYHVYKISINKILK